MSEQKLCEWCGERLGEVNSRYWIDREWEEEDMIGHWVCHICEEGEIETVHNNHCPCGCDGPGDEEHCAYAKAWGTEVSSTKFRQ